MAPAGLDRHAEREAGVLVGFGDGLETVRGAGSDVDGHGVAVVVFARVGDCYGLP